MLISTEGLIIRETEYGENDKMLTLLTPSLGKITVSAKGVKSIKNPHMQISQLFCYNDFVLSKKGDRYWLREAAQIENFYELQSDLEKYSLAQYFLDIAGEICVEGPDEADMMRLVLNTLFMLANGNKPQKLIKAVFELRAASISGFMPDLTGCADCSDGSSDIMYFDIINGVIRCAQCYKKASNENLIGFPDTYTVSSVISVLDVTVLAAMRYIIGTRPERIFSFEIPEKELDDLGIVCEKYLLNQLERGFKTLDFYKEIKDNFNGDK